MVNVGAAWLKDGTHTSFFIEGFLGHVQHLTVTQALLAVLAVIYMFAENKQNHKRTRTN